MDDYPGISITAPTAYNSQGTTGPSSFGIDDMTTLGGNGDSENSGYRYGESHNGYTETGAILRPRYDASFSRKSCVLRTRLKLYRGILAKNSPIRFRSLYKLNSDSDRDGRANNTSRTFTAGDVRLVYLHAGCW